MTRTNKGQPHRRPTDAAARPVRGIVYGDDVFEEALTGSMTRACNRFLAERGLMLSWRQAIDADTAAAVAQKGRKG